MSISTDNYNERSDTMAIQNRRGLMADFDPNKLLPGEFAFPIDTGEVYYCVAPGNVKRVATKEELQEILTSSPEAYTALKQLLSDLEDDPSELTNILTNISNLQSGKLDKAGDSKDNTVTFTEASEDTDIVTGESHSTIFGKILKSIKTLRSGLAGKFDKTNIVQSAEISDTGKVPSAAVTNGLANQITQLNNNLANIKSGVVTVSATDGYYAQGTVTFTTPFPTWDSYEVVLTSTTENITMPHVMYTEALLPTSFRAVIKYATPLTEPENVTLRWIAVPINT